MRIQAIAGILMMAGTLFGQSFQRQANLVGNGSLQQGRCTVEVIVDGSAEVQLRGTTGLLRNVNGQPPQWGRFDCTGPMPANPARFNFSGVAGRGSQQLMRDPSRAAYAFDIEWRGYGPSGPVRAPNLFDPQNEGPIISTDAVNVCQREIMRQATQRFGRNRIYFRRTSLLDDNRGGPDRVRGAFDIDTRNNQSQRYRFNCLVNLNTGRVQTAQIDRNPVNQNARDYGYFGGGHYEVFGVTNSNRTIEACENALDRRLEGEGLQRVFGSVDIEDRTGNNRVFGTVSATDRSGREQTVDFTCNVNFAAGTVASVNFTERR